MFCKSGILIFIFAEDNYSIYAHSMLIKTPLLHQSFGPRVLLSLSLSLFLSLPLSLSGYFFGAQRLSEFTFQSGLPRPSREGTFSPSRGRLRPLWTEQVLCRGFIGFLVNQGISASFSLLYFLISWLQTTRFRSIKGPQYTSFVRSDAS